MRRSSSHRLMLRAGLVRRLGSGLYSWMPLGLSARSGRSRRSCAGRWIAAGALEIFMPSVQPAELWQESGSLDEVRPGAAQAEGSSRGATTASAPPTRRSITDIARRELRSYRQLPINLYQIQTKFRDEIRPRFGVMRAREFIMKDAYSFDVDASGHAA